MAAAARASFVSLLIADCLFALCFARPALAADPGHEFFEKRVRPILVARCYACHSGTKSGGGLSLETREGWQRGGDSGPAIVAGKPSSSLLVEAINYQSLEMPPRDSGGQLSKDEIAAITEWIERGAEDPRDSIDRIGGMTAEQAKSWWAFQQLPVFNDRLTPSAIDSLLENAITEAGLTANPPADKLTLIRRATYDLTGLPPTADEVAAFVSDESPDAYQRLVERLLASPQYGVRWGRRWLDVVRYADTAGENTDRPLPHAWRYRNWVFDAFNRDLPYDEFAKLQIAGDLLRANEGAALRAEGVIATGYLAIARRFGHDIDKDIHLTHEDVIDNLCKTFLGLTGGCARCHDHKYDPITTADYYGLYGIFDSTRFSFPGCEPKGQPRDLVPLLTEAEFEERMAPWKAAQAKRDEALQLRESTARQQIKQLTDSASQILLGGLVAEGSSVPLTTPDGAPLQVTLRQGEVVQLTVSPNGNHGADSTLVEWSIAAAEAPEGGAAASWSVADVIGDFTRENPWRDADGARWCFLDATDGAALLAEPHDTLGEHAALRAWTLGELPSAFVNTSEAPVDVWTRLPAKSLFVHPGPQRPVAIAWICPADGAYTIRGQVADAHPAGLDGVSFQLTHIADRQAGTALINLYSDPAQLPPNPGPAPLLPVAFAVSEGEPHNVRIHERGEPGQPGDEAQRRWLSVLGGQPVDGDAGSGREQLAQWIVAHPLSTRVMVNRIWAGHFGNGLVRSLNDFGSRGEQPSHPELLERLAAEFAESGFHMKAIHRLIMHTRAYQRSSEAPPEVVQADSNNRLLCRFDRRRLSAEEIRDSLLFAAGKLDQQPGEAHPFPPESSWTFTQHNPFHAVYETNKRSAFLMVQRQRRHPFLAQFDGADPNASTPSRETTTVPTQALFFLNDPFFHDCATSVANRVGSIQGSPQRIHRAYQILFQREPNAAEIERAERFLRSYPAESDSAWPGLVRVLLASNEFLHVD